MQVYYTLLGVFLKEAWYGPSFFQSHNAEKKLKHEELLRKNIFKSYTPPLPQNYQSLIPLLPQGFVIPAKL
jgi:hypothetical protein